MERLESRVLTPQDLRKQFNSLGLCLILAVVIAFGLQFGITFAESIFIQNMSQFNRVAINMIYEILIAVILFFVPFLVLQKTVKIKFNELIKPFSWKISAVISQIAMGIAIYLFLTFITNSVYYTLNFAMVSVTNIHPAFLESNIFINISYVIYFVLFLPLIEEYIFRGIILRMLSYVGATFGMIATSIIFALCFFGQTSVIVNFGISLFLCLITMMHQTIWPSYIVRIAIQCTIVAGVYLPMHLGWLFGVIAVIVYTISIYAAYLYRNRKIVLNQSVPIKEAWTCFFTSWVLDFAIILLIFLGVYYILI